MAYVSDEELVRRLEAYRAKGGNYSAAAQELGIARSTLQDSVKLAVRRNLSGDWQGEKLPEGYHMGLVTRHVKDGEVVEEWQRMSEEGRALEILFNQLAEAMKQEIIPVPEITGPAALGYSDHLLVLYPIVDVHLGQYSWGKETGDNYDLDIAKAQFLKATTSLFQLTPNAEEALVVVLGDFFHADNNEATTRRSGNHLDVDGRHDKVLHVGGELLVWEIDMALQRHKYVRVKVMRGNHDEYASKALTLALYLRYQNNPRVIVERSPLDLWSTQWGKNMLGFTHGDNVKAEDMPGVMAATEAVMWGDTTYRYAFSGHFHKRKAGPLSDEKHGAIWEIIPAFTAKDAWNRSMGHSSLRSIQAITFHKEEGRKFTTYANI